MGCSEYTDKKLAAKNLLDKIQALRNEIEDELTRPYIKVRDLHLITIYMSQLEDYLEDETKGCPLN